MSSREAQRRWELENDIPDAGAREGPGDGDGDGTLGSRGPSPSSSSMRMEPIAHAVASSSSAPRDDAKLGHASHAGSESASRTAAMAMKGKGKPDQQQQHHRHGDEDDDDLWRYRDEVQSAITKQAPWEKDPHYFKVVHVSALALLKMTIHTKTGGNIEVMGMLQGKPMADGSIVVIDVFALPVEGTETRVNAQAEAYEYMVEYNQQCKRANRRENVVGWYHSHPGYGCWLSGIDVATQMLNQEYQEPFLAIVIDPIRTQSAGKVEIGAFRTYPKDYQCPEDVPSTYQTIPLSKVEDFGVHCKRYYSLDVRYFKSSLDAHLFDLLWTRYWAATLSSSKMIHGTQEGDYLAGQIADLGEKVEQVEGQLAHSGRLGGMFTGAERNKQSVSHLAKVAHDAAKVAAEQSHGMISQVIKNKLFNQITADAGHMVLES